MVGGQVKDLEVMYTNVIGTAFEGVQRIPDCVALLEIFYSLAKLDAIKRCVEKKTAEVYELFIRQVERTRHEFDENRRNPPIRESEPEFAGAALWARSLGVMIHQNWALLKESTFLLHSRETDEAEMAYKSLMTVVNDFKLNRYQAWVERLNAMDPTNLLKRLETPLMRRATPIDEQTSVTPIKAGQLVCNFDRDLAALFIEVRSQGSQPARSIRTTRPPAVMEGDHASVLRGAVMCGLLGRWCTGRSSTARSPSRTPRTTSATSARSCAWCAST